MSVFVSVCKHVCTCLHAYEHVMGTCMYVCVLSVSISEGVCVNVNWCMDLSRKCPANYYEKRRYLLKKIRDTRNTVHRTMTPQSSSK